MFTLPSLPWLPNQLEPFMSENTLSFHYGKHHQAYINNLNSLIKDTTFEKLSLPQIILKSSGPLFNNAAQVWNHSFFWESLAPRESYSSAMDIANQIDQDFGSFENFKEQFTKSAVSLFGSGWVWLVLNSANQLQIIPMANAGNPIVDGKIPLLVCDVWEHAYYLDYQNRRGDYIEKFWNIINWNKVEERYQNAIQE